MIRILILIVFLTSSIVYFPYLYFYEIKKIDDTFSSAEKTLNRTDDLDSYLNQQEIKFTHLRPGLEKKITWNNPLKKDQTEYAFIYLPGFTATKKEISPVVENLALQFKANSFFSRLPSHGEEADDYSNAKTVDFFESAIEAVLIGEKLGKKPIFIGVSTGASLLQYVLNRRNSGHAFIALSPAFYSRWHVMNVALNPWIGLSLIKMVMGEYYHWNSHFPNQELYWNTKYNTDIIPHLTRVFQITSQEDYSNFKIPYYLMYNEKDKTINYKMMLEKWGQSKNSFNTSLAMESRDSHVIAGDITSPENTQLVIDRITDWLRQIP